MNRLHRLLWAALLAGLAVTTAGAQQLPGVPDHDNDAFRCKLRGPVRSQVTTVIIPNDVTDLAGRGESYILEEKFAADGTRRVANIYTLKDVLVAKTELLYDRNGFATEAIYSDLNGNMLNRFTYEYAADGRNWKRTVNYDPYYNPLGIYYYYYDGAGRVSEIRETNEEGKVRARALFAYDDFGNLVEQLNFDGKDTQVASTEMLYNRRGRQLSYRTVGQGDSLRVYAEANYQGDTLLTDLTIDIYEQNRPATRTRYEYDALGNLLTSVQIDLAHPDAAPVKTLYIYEWDLHGNWTKQAIVRDGVEQVAAERVIDYYAE
jgi:hypothetical protein